MNKKRLITVYGLVSIALVLVNVKPADAYVTPQIGGGQVGKMDAPMIMPEITFDGTNVVVLNMMGNHWTALTGTNRPVLRPLTGTDAFDPAKMWYSSLNGKAYNWQYGWSNGSLDPCLIPAGDKIWIELINQSQGLKTYDRNNNYTPIFGTGGVSNIWKWNETMSMSHNAYTVTPGVGDWFATYKVYLGDATTGAALPGFGSDTVTLTWVSIPEPATMALMGTGIVYLLGSRRKHKATT